MSAGRVVVVGDELLVRERISSILASEGYDVSAAADADRAEMLLEPPPDLLIVHASSAEASADLARMRQGRDVPLLVVSSAADGPSLAFRLGADAFLMLPHPAPTLVESVRRLCESGRRPTGFLLIHGDRRSSSRPTPGEFKPCPLCDQAMRFQEPERAEPAWVCRNAKCRHLEFVRGRTSPEVQAAP
jgi:DNA-binding response OmpR family regulator